MTKRTSRAASIEISHSSAIRRRDLDDLRKALARPTLRISVTTRALPGIRGHWEWVLPATVILYLSKAFFDSFLKELGSAAGKRVTTALAELFDRVKRRGIRDVNADDLRCMIEELQRAEAAARQPEEETLHRYGRPYPPIELHVQMSDGRTVRFQLTQELDSELAWMSTDNG